MHQIHSTDNYLFTQSQGHLPTIFLCSSKQVIFVYEVFTLPETDIDINHFVGVGDCVSVPTSVNTP